MSPSDGREPQAREPEAPSPLEVLEEISLRDVLALGSEGTDRVDWSSLVEDRSGTCPDCGQPDGPRHHKSCIAHPRPPSFWWPVGVTFGLAGCLSFLVGPGAFLFFVPLLVLGLLIRAR